MKLHHIDRNCLLHEGQVLQLQNDFYISNKGLQKCVVLTNEYFENWLSNYGIIYFINGLADKHLCQ